MTSSSLLQDNMVRSIAISISSTKLSYFPENLKRNLLRGGVDEATVAVSPCPPP